MPTNKKTEKGSLYQDLDSKQVFFKTDTGTTYKAEQTPQGFKTTQRIGQVSGAGGSSNIINIGQTNRQKEIEREKIRQEEIKRQNQERVKQEQIRREQIKQKQNIIRQQTQNNQKKLFNISQGIKQRLAYSETESLRLANERGRIRERLAKQRQSIQGKTLKESAETRKKILKNQFALDKATAKEFLINQGLAIASTPQTIKTILKDPAVLKQIPSASVESGKKFIQLAKKSPTEAVIIAGGNLLMLKGTSQGIKITGKVTKAGTNKILNLNPTLKKLKKERVFVNGKYQDVEVINIKTPKKIINLSKIENIDPLGGKIKVTIKGKKAIDKLIVGDVGTFLEPLPKAIKRAGQKQTVAVSSIANKIIGRYKRRVTIKKPFIGEENLNKQTKALLKKFDEGTITKREKTKLQKDLRKQTISKAQPKGTDLLERSQFFDPDKGLRKSRLKVDKSNQTPEGTLSDLLTGKARLSLFNGEPIPQVIVTIADVEKFPKSLKKIVKKLKANKPLTDDELTKLSNFQTTPSGKLKPVGSTTYSGGVEREVTLPSPEKIKYIRTLATLKLEGKRIPITQVKIIKGKTKVNKIRKVENFDKKIKKLETKKLKINSSKILSSNKLKRINRIDKKIKSQKLKLSNFKKTIKDKEIREFLNLNVIRTKKGFKSKKGIVQRRRGKVTKRYPAGRRLVSGTRFFSLRRGFSSRRPTRTGRTIRPSTRPPRTGRPPTRPPRTGRPLRPVRTARTARTGRAIRGFRIKPLLKPLRIIPPFPKLRNQKLRNLKKSKQGYIIYEKRAGKFKRLQELPLTLNKAKDKASFRMDNKLSRRIKLKAIGKVRKVGSISNQEKGYFNFYRNKIRDYKIKRKNKIPIQLSWIEKRKYSLDKAGEKVQIKLNRNKTPRNVLLARLKKARAVRMSNLRKKR